MAGFAYSHANAVIAVSSGLRQEVIDRYRIDPTRVIMIYNPTVPDDQLRQERLDRPSGNVFYRIVALGRLVRLKGFDSLIRAVARLPGPWHLDIWGDGPERAYLEAIIGGEGAEGKIQLRGYTEDPFPLLRAADLFVLSSRHEGLSSTLIEAMASQCQLVATDCPHGPCEILNGGQLGQLVPVDNANALAEAIMRSMSGQHYVEPRLLRERARDFSQSVCCSRWESVLRGL